MSWNNIIGHDWAVELLSGAIANGRIGHAYLLTGPDQIGKTTLALTFAQALNCEADAAQRPCGHCRTCELIASNRHPDVRLVEPEVSGRGKYTLKIEAIRDLNHSLNLAAYEARQKVAILTRFDAATIGAANAFLKTLEEPPSNVVLLLTAADGDTLLSTIVSRCRTIGLRPLPTDLVEESLATRWGVAADQAELLAHLADGRLGWAVEAAQNDAPLKERSQHIGWLYDALKGSRVDRFRLANKLGNKAEELPDILRTWLSWWRDAALLAQDNGRIATLTNIDERDTLSQLAAAWDAKASFTSLQQTDRAIWQLTNNGNTRLVLENLLLIYPLPPTQ